jgi:hypothetical protein
VNGKVKSEDNGARRDGKIDSETFAITRPASYNESKARYVPPIPDDDVLAILRRAATEIGKRCHLWPCMREHQRTRQDGWVKLGSIGVIESDESYQVWWHRERQDGRLWPWVLTPHGWHVQLFPFESAPR